MTDLPHYLLHPEGDRWELDQAAKVWGFLRYGVPPLDLRDLSVTHRRLRRQAEAELRSLADIEELPLQPTATVNSDPMPIFEYQGWLP